MATLCTLGASTVVIWRRCTSLTRPCGNSMKMSMVLRSRTASMAAEPVSPEVAPTMVACWCRGRQRVVEHAAQQLQRHVLEGERRAVEQLQQMQAPLRSPSGFSGATSGVSNEA